MAEAIICDACGITCKPSDAKHVRMHRLASATSYNTAVLAKYDVCNKCYSKLDKFLGGKTDAITGHSKTAD